MLNEFIKFSDWSITTLIALSPLVGMLLALVFPETSPKQPHDCLGGVCVEFGATWTHALFVAKWRL